MHVCSLIGNRFCRLATHRTGRDRFNMQPFEAKNGLMKWVSTRDVGLTVIDVREKQWSYTVPLSKSEEERFEKIISENIVVDLHEHPTLHLVDMIKTQPSKGREVMAYEALSLSGLDSVFDNMMDGGCAITSKHGNHQADVVQNLGMRLCDIAQQDFVIHCRTVKDIEYVFKTGKLAQVAVIETLNCIENEVDKIDVLQGLGLRQAGITYSEPNMLGSGLKELGDSGLTDFGYDVLVHMNKVGMLVDVSHCGDKTAIDTIELSKDPIIISHCGSRTITPKSRMLPADALLACAERGRVLGLEMAGAILWTKKHPVATIESYKDQIEYCIDILGIDHVGCGPDTLYGDHIGLYKAGAYKNKMNGMGHAKRLGEGDMVLGIFMDLNSLPEYVKGMENPTKSMQNIARMMIKNGYSNEKIAKVLGGNGIRLLERVW